MESLESNRPFLEGITGLYKDKEYYIEAKEFVIGRNPDCHLIMKESTISGRHAKIIRTGDIYEIQDLGSTNKTYVNGKEVERKRLRTADKIRLDVFEFTFVNPQDVVRTELSDGDIMPDLPKTVIRTGEADSRPSDSVKTQPMIKENSGVVPKRPVRRGNLFLGLTVGLLVTLILSWGGLLLSAMMQNRSASAGISTLFRSMLEVFPLLHLHTYWLNIGQWSPSLAIGLICMVMALLIGGIISRDLGRRKRSYTALIFSFLYILITVIAQLAAIRFDLASWKSLPVGAGLGMPGPLLNLILVLAYFWAVSFLFSFIGTWLGKK